MKLGSEKFKERLENTFREDVNNLVQRRRRETLSWPSKIAEGSPLSGDAALALVRICLTPRSRRGNLEQGTKTMLKPEESPHWAKEPILAGRAAATWLAKRPVWHPDFKGKSLQKVDGLVEIPYIF